MIAALIAVVAIAAIAVALALVIARRRQAREPARPVSRATPGPSAPRGSAAPEPGPASPGPGRLPAPPAALAALRILRDDELAPDRRAALKAALGRIALPSPALPRLLSPEFLQHGSSRELAEIIAGEPEIAARLLATVNSPAYGLQQPVNGIGQAVTFLGTNAVRDLFSRLLIGRSFGESDARLRDACERLLDASAIASDLCGRLARRLALPDAGALSARTLLSYVGRLAMTRLMPPEETIATLHAGPVERTVREQAQVGVASPVVGAMLMREWGLPEDLVQGALDIDSVLTTPCGTRAQATDAGPALGYACARIVDAVASGRTAGLADVDFLAGDPLPETYHLRGYLAREPLARLQESLRQPDILNTVGVRMAALGKY